ncbi:hypothetical protein ACFYPC_22025 [Streptomyces sp. NPDC005808]|uniref:hypothetical protein n=1 Tax=Streptomyces sp. NPDC005808 TaxID=3364734 RepID=UPI00369F53D5
MLPRRLLSSIVAVALATAFLTSCGNAGTDGQESQGKALDGGMQSQAELGFEHAQIGQEYWVSLPETTNVSSSPLTILNAEITHVPKGLEVLEYKAVSEKDTDGHAMGVGLAGEGGTGEMDHARDHAGRPIAVKPNSAADIYYLARVKVTAPVRGDLTGCRYRYRQGTVEYRQDLRCVTQIRLGEPLKNSG